MVDWSGQLGQSLCTVRRRAVVVGVLLAFSFTIPTLTRGSGQAATADLIDQLGSRSFQRREQAESELRELGVDVLPTLQDAANNGNLEVRYRVRRLMQSIEHQHQLRLLKQFLTKYDPELAQQLAGWTQFSEWVGDDLPARRLFVEMYEAEPELMSLVGRSSPELPFVLESRTAELNPSHSGRPTNTVVPAAATAVLLFVSLDPTARAGSATKTAVHSLVNKTAFRQAADRSTDPPVLRLLGAWVSRARDVHASIRMKIGNDFTLDEAVEPALELIRARVGSNQLQEALFTVARLGTAEQVPELERLFEDESVLAELQRREQKTFTSQVRDVALVAAIHVIGKHPRAFGFRDLRPNPRSLYALNTAGFHSDESRTAAFRLWKLWRHVQRFEFLEIDENAAEGIRL